MKLIVPTALLLIAACAQPAADNAATPEITDAQAESVPADNAIASAGEWTGKWIGVEGLALDIQPGDTPDTRKLTVTLLDGTNDYIGTVGGNTIEFTRDGKAETIRHGTGADTGLKYLADKTDCLIIKSGEGFCRG